MQRQMLSKYGNSFERRLGRFANLRARARRSNCATASSVGREKKEILGFDVAIKTSKKMVAMANGLKVRSGSAVPMALHATKLAFSCMSGRHATRGMRTRSS
jgi:hypothetical protein